MDKKPLLNIFAGLFIFTQCAISVANVTDATKSYQTLNEHQKTEIFTSLSSTEPPHLIPARNSSSGPPVLVAESSKRKKVRFLQGRPRRQGYDSSPVKYGTDTHFDMCPPLGTSCPQCSNEPIQVPPDFCNLVVLKVISISTPQTDGNDRVCGKFGMLQLYGDFNEKEFRRLLRFSVSGICGCNVKASALYFLMAPLSHFLQERLLYSKIVLTEHVILIAADRYIEKEIFDALNSCPVTEYNPDVAVPYDPSPAVDPIPIIDSSKTQPAPNVLPPAPYGPPATKPPAAYAPSPAQYVPPPAPYQPQPTKPPAIYVPPPAPYVPSPAPYGPPSTKPPAPYAPSPAPYVPPPAPHEPRPTQPPAIYVTPPAPYVPSPAPYGPQATKPPAPYVPPATNPPTPYVPPPITPSIPYVPPAISPPAPYVSPPGPYIPPPNQPPLVYPLPPAPPPPYIPPPIEAPVPPPTQLPVSTSYQVQPVRPQVPSKQLQPSHHRGKTPFLYPSLTQCLIPDTCPVCARLDNAGDITPQYCVAGFAHLAVIRVPDASLLQGADSTYSGPTCMNLRTNIVYDITRTRDPTIVITALTALLPTKCLSCFEGLSGPIIVLIMGKVPPVPPVAQIDASFQVYILPVPSTIVLPSCETYSLYGNLAVPYSLLPTAPQPDAADDCPEAGDQTCPECKKFPDGSFAEACAKGFAIVAEIKLAGPYFTSQRLPTISVRTSMTYYSKSVEVVIANPLPIECVKGYFKILQNIGFAPLDFPGEIIPFVSLPACECVSQEYKKLLIFSTGPLITSEEGVLHLSKDINMAFITPGATFPTCGTPSPPPPVYKPPQPFYIPPHQIPPTSYARPARVPLTYIPPPPPPPAYVLPTDPPPVYILPPNYIPPPVKESSSLQSHWYKPPHLITSPTPLILTETQPPLNATELSFEEARPQIIECLELVNGSCIFVDTIQDNESQFPINVEEEIPYLSQFESLDSIIYKDVSVWAPSFEECLCATDQVTPSCPQSFEDIPEKFEEIFCKAKTALVVAVGIDYSNLGNDTSNSKMLSFIQPEIPYVGINYEDPDNPMSLTITITPNKTMDRRIQMQNNPDNCYKERVLVLFDISNVLMPKTVVGTLEIYIPGFCDSEMFDKIPSYGILLSKQQPSDVKNPVQLTENFTFIPLPEGTLSLPDCGKSLEGKPSGMSSPTEFWVPTTPADSPVCELPSEDRCPAWTTVIDGSYLIPCNFISAALVLIQSTSAGNSVGPNLKISEVSYESGEREVLMNVKSNVDEEFADSFLENQYANDFNLCKYSTMRILKDISRDPSLAEDDVVTIVANKNCDNQIFKLTNQVVLLLSDKQLFPHAFIPFDQIEVVGITPGTTKISLCSQNPPDDDGEETALEKVEPFYEEDFIAPIDQEMPPDDVKENVVKEVTPLQNEPIASVGQEPEKSVDETSTDHKKTSDTYDISSNVETHQQLETSCAGHVDNTCPVCEDVGSISSEVYCNSELSLFAEVIRQELENGSCTNGVIASIFDITARNGLPATKVMKISYTLPSHCSCSVLKEGGHLVLVLDKATPKEDELSISLTHGKYLYSTPLRIPFPSCKLEDSVQARTKTVDNEIILEPPYEELRKVIPALSRNLCPSIDHTCPVCRSMEDEELETLYCSSEEVLLVSRSKNQQRENPKKFPRIGTASFIQHKVASNYSLEMIIDTYESPCGLPLANGNCSESLDRFYYDAEDEMCSDFTYTGCGGNANNFVSQEHCEKRCFTEDFCEEGILDIKKIMKSSDNANYMDNKFHYALPDHCNCSQILKGNKKGYLLSTKVEDLRNGSIQLSRNYYFVPLSKSQQKNQFSCTEDGKSTDSSESNSKDNEAIESTDLQTFGSSESKQKKMFGFLSWG